MGASAVWIAQALKDVNPKPKMQHIAIDPNQSSQYDNLGRLLVNRCGLSKFVKVIEEPSYSALPKLLGKRVFQLIYIDGWHTFDYTLVDFFYADLLLKVGGVIIIDDIRHKSVRKFFNYVINNYPHYKLIRNTPCYKEVHGETDWTRSTQATFLKKGQDERSWNFHEEF